LFWFLNQLFPCSSLLTTPKDFDRCVPNAVIRDPSDGSQTRWWQRQKWNSVVGNSWKRSSAEHNREVEPINSQGPQDVRWLSRCEWGLEQCWSVARE
jgi:hypothetical protein